MTTINRWNRRELPLLFIFAIVVFEWLSLWIDTRIVKMLNSWLQSWMTFKHFQWMLFICRKEKQIHDTNYYQDATEKKQCAHDFFALKDLINNCMLFLHFLVISSCQLTCGFARLILSFLSASKSGCSISEFLIFRL